MNSHSAQILPNKVTLDNKFEPHISVEDKLSKLKKTKPPAISFNYDDAASSKNTVFVDTNCNNGFAAAILHAYNYNKHLCLSPDEIWLTIVQGVSHHINYNLEKFRHRCIKNEEKNGISAFVGDILDIDTLEDDWQIVNKLVMITDEHVEEIESKELLECDFSTISSNLTTSRTVSLDTSKAYFSYKFTDCCVIPKVTLEGTLEDWDKLQERVIQLKKLNLELDFWLDRLEPVVLKLVAAYSGEVDEEFWGRIININEVFGSEGGTYISGWMLAFFPYDRAGNQFPYTDVEIFDIPDDMTEFPFIADTDLFLRCVAGNSDNESVVSLLVGWFMKFVSHIGEFAELGLN
ncbi:1981_t:CDS:1 [Cetraspora pellucida]|uniref:1981_t:CDS:1 n=1 Tax=Cetraspora pellucida TaxID=1433469 RepID=A0A9N9BC94_9GLOM|nr:1981_t:CDS:1 [Cetraspora pellucida]